MAHFCLVVVFNNYTELLFGLVFPGTYFVAFHVFLCSRSILLCRFDKRITIFAEEKFHRDGIDLRTGEMVTKVTDKEISTKVIKTGETSTIPYGMAVWSTGIATRPVVMDFMKQIGQVYLTPLWI